MKILYDHQIFSHQRFGGVSRYFTNLINHADKNKNIETKLGLVTSKNEYMPKSFDFISKRLGKKLYKRIISINKKKSKRLLENYNYDVFHPTYYNPYFLPFLKDKPFVLTVHDMMPELFPEFYPSDFSDIVYKKLLVKKASKIIAVSNQTKNDLIKLLSVDEKKISVVHHCVNLKSKQIKNHNYKIPKNYLLYVGSRILYKNFTTFIKSIAPILIKHSDLKLVLAGGGEITESEKKLICKLNLKSNIVHFKNFDDHLLSLLYTNAKAFIFPSLYEGFGIPILESFSNHCPVLLSDTPVFKEIAEDNCLYFDPKSEESIRDKIQNILEDDKLRKKLIKKGLTRLSNFTPDKTFFNTLDVYKSIS